MQKGDPGDCVTAVVPPLQTLGWSPSPTLKTTGIDSSKTTYPSWSTHPVERDYQLMNLFASACWWKTLCGERNGHLHCDGSNPPSKSPWEDPSPCSPFTFRVLHFLATGRQLKILSRSSPSCHSFLVCPARRQKSIEVHIDYITSPCLM